MLTFRRIAPIVVAASVLVLPACSTTSNDAARVDGRSLSADELDDLIVGYAESAGEGGFNPAGTVSADVARSLLTTWVSTTVNVGLIEAAGGSVTDEDLSAAREILDAEPGFAEADERVRTFFIWNAAVATKLSEIFAPDSQELESLYESGASSSGAVCVRAILVATKEEIDAVALRLFAGEEFADVAADVSIDPSGADGGILTGAGGNNCLEFADVVESVAPSFVDALGATAIGEVSQPFEITDTGWAVVLQRPFDEVADDLIDIFGVQASQSVSSEALASARIWIDAEYGRWNPTSGTVVSLG